MERRERRADWKNRVVCSIAGYPRHLIVVTYLVEDWGSLGENQSKKRAAKFARDIKVTTR